MENYVLIESSGKFFVDPCFHRWYLTDDINKATKFTREEAEEMREVIELAVVITCWDKDEVIPYPEIKEISIKFI